MKTLRLFVAGLYVSGGVLGIAAPAFAGVDVGVYIGVPGVYVQPAPVVVQPAPVYSYPAPVLMEPRPIYVQPRPVYRIDYDGHRHHWHQRPRWSGRHDHHFRGEHRPHRYRDFDRDGVPNYRDRDRDGDGVGNRHDRRPNNPYRY